MTYSTKYNITELRGQLYLPDNIIMTVAIHLPLLLVLLCLPLRPLAAQVYSPKVLAEGQVDASDAKNLARTIYAAAEAVTDREKAEAIWRFFLTDGRFVKPGFWYHIAGWTYEEPNGEVLDVVKLLNSYGFGLCYHVAPLLEAVFEAGGFEDARTWFLHGHTVAEVYYGGAYHHYDSDMLGYNCLDGKSPVNCTVASVHQIEEDGGLITGKLLSPAKANPALVDYPWYPADLRARAIGGLAELFTTAGDNRLFPFQRYSEAHTMDFVLRRGERLIRYFEPEKDNLFYLPYRFDGDRWHEFPKEIARWRIRTADGPHSQKDTRRWGTGRLEYIPPLAEPGAYYPATGEGFNENLRLPAPGAPPLLRAESAGVPARAVFEMPSPYVIINARFSLSASLAGREDSLLVETSTDDGRNWESAGRLHGPWSGAWKATPKVLTQSDNGEHNAVAGTYGYLVRLTLRGAAAVSDIKLTTWVELNPRTLPALKGGLNRLTYYPGGRQRRREIPVRTDQVERWAKRISNLRYAKENGQGFLLPESAAPGDVIFELSVPGDASLTGFDAGGRFLDLRDGIAPDKLTAEVRKTVLGPHPAKDAPQASLSWSTSLDGEYRPLWRYCDNPVWLDNKPVKRLLRWPEVDRRVHSLPPGTRKVYVRYRIAGMALDNLRLAVLSDAAVHNSRLEITHIWLENGQEKRHIEQVADTSSMHTYIVRTGEGTTIKNRAVVFQCF